MSQRTIVITGANGGIGLEVLCHFHNLGWRVLALTRSFESRDDLRTRFHGSERMWSMRIDLSNPSLIDLNYFNSLLSNCGCINILAACHGAKPCIKPTTDLEESEWQDIIDTDLGGMFRLCQAVYPYMNQNGGLIVLTSSFHAIGSYPMRAPYAAAKAGVCGLTRSLACEWARNRIRVNAIAPGQVDNQRTRDLANEAKINAMKKRSPAGRLVDPMDIAKTIEMLWKIESINGQTLVLDHGVTASLWYEAYEAK